MVAADAAETDHKIILNYCMSGQIRPFPNFPLPACTDYMRHLLSILLSTADGSNNRASLKKLK